MRYLSALFFAWSFFTFLPPCAAERHAPGAYSAHESVKPLIILDAGHGGHDEGAKVRAFQEKKVTLLATLLTKKRLEELGYRVLLTRSRDAFIPLQKRVSIANRAKALLFVSIHFNSSPNVEAHGIEVFYHGTREATRTRASQRLANCILYRVLDQTEAHSRGVKHGNFHVIRETDMPAVLVEGGFMTNLEERRHLKDKTYLDRLALGIAQGVDRYLKT